MPIQLPQWTEYLSCPVCENGFDAASRPPISLGCGHSICKACLANLQRAVCPYDQGAINFALSELPVNTALLLLVDGDTDCASFRPPSPLPCADADAAGAFRRGMAHLEQLALYLRPSNRQQLSRPMQRKLVTLINCQLLEEDGRLRAGRSARSLGERSVTELILQHQNPQQLSANLWAAVRARGCQFLGPAMQEEVLKLVLLALEDGSALSRKVLVMFVVQRLEPHFPQASKTSIGHVVQLLYRASCFKVTKRDGDSSLMQLKEEFRTYDTLRREHDAQIVQIATEAGLRIAPDQWSSLLYGDTAHKSHMQSIIDKLQTPQSFQQSVQELVIALQRTGDPGQLGSLRPHLDLLAAMDPSPDSPCPEWEELVSALGSVCMIVAGLVAFMDQHAAVRRMASGGELGQAGAGGGQSNPAAAAVRYKTSLCRDLASRGSCPRGKNCTFAHSQMEIEQHRQNRRQRYFSKPSPVNQPQARFGGHGSAVMQQQQPHGFARGHQLPTFMHHHETASATGPLTPVAQVAPLPREAFANMPHQQQQQQPPQAMLAAPPPPQPALVAAAAPPSAVLPMFPTAEQVVPVAPVAAVAAVAPVPDMMGLTANVPPVAAVPVAAAAPLVVQFPASDDLVMSHAQQQQQSRSMSIEHESNLERYPLRDDPSGKKEPPPVTISKGMAAKSLSALKSRKEEIIDYLEDLVGKEETAKITNFAAETAPPMTARLLANQTHNAAEAANAMLAHDSGNGEDETPASVPSSAAGFYSIWTSKSIATLPASRTASNATEAEDDDEGLLSQIASQSSELLVEDTPPPEDELIPFSESPQVCRFGPISRRNGTTLLQTVTVAPSQSQAVMGDEPTPTAVVRNSKHMARQAPSMAALYHQNGTCTTLQPVTVGPNGEIGYIAVPAGQQPPAMAQPMAQAMPAPMPAAPAVAAVAAVAPQDPSSAGPLVAPTPPHHQTDITLQQILQNSAAHQHSPSPIHHQSSMQLYAESERMKQELEQLQRKISDLNMAHLDPARNRTAATSSSSHPGALPPPSNNWQQQQPLPPSTARPAAMPQQQQQPAGETGVARKEELAKELVMIESNIRDRERELTINQRMMQQAAFVAPITNDSLGYEGHGGAPSAAAKGIVTTAVAGLRAGSANTSVA